MYAAHCLAPSPESPVAVILIIIKWKRREEFFFFFLMKKCILGFPGGTVVKNLPANAGDMGSVPGLEDPTGCRVARPMHHSY